MIRVSKIADYAVVVMVYMAGLSGQSTNARDIAHHTHVALPTVSKILKMMARRNLLLSHRGAKGGYHLARPAEQISVAQILESVDGQFGMTDCTFSDGMCVLEHICSISSNWRLISSTIYAALESLKLSDMTKPLAQPHVTFEYSKKDNRPRVGNVPGVEPL